MSENATAAQPSADTKQFKFLNVLMHGAFGYVFDNDAIRVYTPACFGHFYAAGGLTSLEKIWQGVDYRLVGVKTPSPMKQTIIPTADTDPVISRGDVQMDRSDIDSYNIRYSMFELPYPLERSERPDLMHSALHELVGEIYTGNLSAATSLNALPSLPSMHILVYELAEGQPCGLLPLNPPNPKCTFLPANQPSQSDPDTINFHVFCSKDPMGSMGGMTDEGHIRRAFAGVVGLLGGLELSLSFPNRFDPALPSAPPPLPVGVEPSDIEPGGVTFNAVHGGQVSPMFGHVNCQYSDLILIP